MNEEEIRKKISESKPKWWDYSKTYSFRGDVCAETLSLKPYHNISIWYWNKYSAINGMTGEYCGTEKYQLDHFNREKLFDQEFIKEQFDRIKKGLDDPNEPEYCEKQDSIFGNNMLTYVLIAGFLVSVLKIWIKLSRNYL